MNLRFKAPLTVREVQEVEFKEMNVRLTFELWNDMARRDDLVKAFVDRVMENACAALNARTNLTLYLGVSDHGVVLGIFVESYLLVNDISSVNYLD